MEIKIITSKSQFEAYRAEASKILARDPSPSSPDGRKFQLLMLVIGEYEKKNSSLKSDYSPVDVVRARMEDLGLNQASLALSMGVTRSRISEILAGKRPLSLVIIKKLSKVLKVPTDFLIEKEDRSETRARKIA